MTIKATTPGQGRPGEGEPVDLSGCVLEPIFVHHYPPPVRIVSEAEGTLALLVRMNEPFLYEGRTWECCVVTNRYKGDSIADATEHRVVSSVSLCHSPSDDPSTWFYAFPYAAVTIGQ